jgi:4-oxalocrotonate tautomerase
MPFVNVRMLRGRSKEQKRRLVQAITGAIADICEAKPAGTMVVIDEVDRENWAVGGVLISDRQG